MICCLTCGRCGFDRIHQPHNCNHGFRKRGFKMAYVDSKFAGDAPAELIKAKVRAGIAPSVETCQLTT